jgi:hypothetical protein
LDDLLPIPRPLFALLLDLDDFPTDEPVCLDHSRVHGTSHTPARGFNDLGDSLEQRQFSMTHQLRHCGTGPLSAPQRTSYLQTPASAGHEKSGQPRILPKDIQAFDNERQAAKFLVKMQKEYRELPTEFEETRRRHENGILTRPYQRSFRRNRRLCRRAAHRLHFFAPSRVLADLRRNASWWAPFLIGALASLLFFYVVDRKAATLPACKHARGREISMPETG